MLEVIRSLPDHFASRDDLIGALEGHGLASATAQWMATNLEHHGGAYRWRFDIDALEALLRDFFRTDLWAVVERPPEDVELHIVKAEESSVLSPDAIARIDAAAAKAPVHLHRVAGGHWLNADNPDALVELVVQWLPADAAAGSG
jgi:pimeloyl-ACP methyl ester carboxylesterase